MTDRILVTGVTGDVGRTVIEQLIGQDVLVRAAARTPANARFAGFKKTEIVLLDYDRPETFAPALKCIGRLFIVPPPLNPHWHKLIKCIGRIKGSIGKTNAIFPASCTCALTQVKCNPTEK